MTNWPCLYKLVHRGKTMLIAKVLWKLSGDCNAKNPAPMKTMQKGPIDTSKTNSAVLKKSSTGNDKPGKKQWCLSTWAWSFDGGWKSRKMTKRITCSCFWWIIGVPPHCVRDIFPATFWQNFLPLVIMVILCISKTNGVGNFHPD